jgi:hypothetical protein
MLLYEHRRSKDIDIFLRDPQYLTALSPRLNDHTEALTGRYVEQSNFLKLIFDGGEVDFIVAPSLTTDPYMTKTVLGTETKVETPVEIVAKKVFYRPEEFSLRDVFDLAFVLDQDPRATGTAAGIRRSFISQFGRGGAPNARRMWVNVSARPKYVTRSRQRSRISRSESFHRSPSRNHHTELSSLVGTHQ